MPFLEFSPELFRIIYFCFSEGVKEEDFIPELPKSTVEPGKINIIFPILIPPLISESQTLGVLPTEICKLVESRRAVKSLLKDPNLSEDQRMQYDIRQVTYYLYMCSKL